MSRDPLDDGISSVELINHMGDDLMVVNAARVSYAKESTQMKDADRRILKYMGEHNHWTPFGHPQLQFRFKMPLFIAREWYRHTIGVVRNEVSRRYVSTEPELYHAAALRMPDAKNKQASTGLHARSHVLSSRMRHTTQAAISIYNDLIKEGVAPEQARNVLPQSMYTEFIETGSLAFYARVCSLRIAEGVQPETRAYAQAVSDLIEPLFPECWKVLRPDNAEGQPEEGSTGINLSKND